ncbi:unnamed protein product [Symbiodinium pilosum]|uniref:Uncharacterized protein n=1 Tax=Symbiodinium pilosum TaxID=2952 RepID=A0A812JMZ2_SYMPI|nr:unnamed protein product [Symbiodinium pilosum]
MFETVLVRVKAELAQLADPITKTPIILFEVPRMDTISSTTKDLSTEGGKAAHVIISASSAAAALAFDAGGANRQKDIWIDDLTAEEAKKVLTLHGHEENAQDIIDACGSRVGDLTASCKEMVAGKTLQELKQETEAAAEREVKRFLDLEVEVAGGRVISIGRNVLTKLANSKQRGGDGAAERSAGQGIVPKMVAGLIRERGAHAVVWHPIQKRYQFASDFHASAAIELLRSQSPNIWAWLRRVFRRG